MCEWTDSCWTYCCVQGETSTSSPPPSLSHSGRGENLWVRHCLHSDWPADTHQQSSQTVALSFPLCVTQHNTASRLPCLHCSTLDKCKRLREAMGLSQHGSLTVIGHSTAHQTTLVIRKAAAKHLVVASSENSRLLSLRSCPIKLTRPDPLQVYAF